MQTTRVVSFLGLRARQGKPSFALSNGKLRPRLEVRDGFAFTGVGKSQSDQPQSRASGLGCELASGLEVDIQCAEGRAGPRQAGLQGDWGRGYQVGKKQLRT